MDKHTPARVEPIRTRIRHYRSFGRKRPMETQGERIISQDGDTTVVARFSQREIFAYESDEFGKFFVDVTGLKRGLADRTVPFEMYEMDLTEEWVTNTVAHNGCEEEHINRLTLHDLDHPGIALMLKVDGDVVMVDGNHRLVRRWREGRKTFTFAVVKIPDAIAYLATDPRKFHDRAFAQ